MVGTMSIMDKTGDTRIEWDSDKPVEVEVAKATFEKAMDKGMLAFKMKKNGNKGEQIHEFDPDTERILLVPAIQGG